MIVGGSWGVWGGGGGVMLTILKVSIILFVLVGTGNVLAIFKTNQYALLSVEYPDVFKAARRGPHCGITPKSTYVIRDEKVTPFGKFEIFIPLFCFFY